MERYAKLNKKLGEGSYGCVFLVQSECGKRMACKEVNVAQITAAEKDKAYEEARCTPSAHAHR